jgi:hypothetical protein
MDFHLGLGVHRLVEDLAVLVLRLMQLQVILLQIVVLLVVMAAGPPVVVEVVEVLVLSLMELVMVVEEVEKHISLLFQQLLVDQLDFFLKVLQDF